MSRTYAQITTLILRRLQDDTTTPVIYVAAETGDAIEESLKELATYDPHIVDVIFKIESRTGSDTAGGTNVLTDTTKSQFVSTDDDNEKVVHNTTDNTWAVVETATASTSVLTITNNIMGSGDSYEIYNKRCKNKKQIYIGDVTDYLDIDSVEYPLGSRRNFKVYGEILEIDIDTVKDSNSTLDPPNDIDVLVRFEKPHKLCQLTDLEGTCSATEAAGVTEVALAGLGATEIIEEGDELHIADHRTVYTVTTGDTTDGSGVATISVFPGMESATAIGDVVTFVKSTLKPQQEEIFCHLVAARTGMSKGAKSLQQIGAAITTLDNVNNAVDAMTAEIARATTDLASARTEVAKTPAIITKAQQAITLVQAQITQAMADAHTGRNLINEISKGGAGVPTTYANYATTALNNARAYADQARINLQQATADESVARSYTGLASGELSKATAQLNQAGGYIREITSRLSIASTFRLYQEWGERKLAEVLGKLERLSPPKTSRVYPKD